MRRRATAIALALSLCGAFAPLAASAAAGQRIDLKVLLLSANGNEPSFGAWRATLDAEGVPYTAFVASQQAAITATTLAQGTTRAYYQAVILSSDSLGGQLSASEWTALSDFERTFGVRRITAYAWPNPSVGLNYPHWSGDVNGMPATLTSAGLSVFQTLRGPVTINDTYGYLANPLAGFQTLLTAPSGEPLLGTYTQTDGREQIVFTADSSIWTSHHRLLAHGMLSWATRGVFLGISRNYLSFQPDDLFLPNDRWDVATHRTVFDGSIRMTPADVVRARDWSVANNFRLDFAFNAGGASASDGLTQSILGNKASFGFVNHTFDHLDLTNASSATIQSQIQQNVDWAVANGLPVFDGRDLVTGGHSGLQNPNMPGALSSTGITAIASDNSVSPATYMIGPARATPRYPTDIYYNTSTRAEQLDEYNWIYVTNCNGGGCLPATVTWAQYVDIQATQVLSHATGNDPRVHFVHQSNLTDDAYLLEILDEVLRRYDSTFTVPFTQLLLGGSAQLLARNAAWRAAQSQATGYLQDGHVVIYSPVAVDVPVTGTTAGEMYGGQRSGYVFVPAGGTVDLVAGGGSPNTPPVASGQSVSTAEDTPVAVALQASDPDGQPLTYSVVNAPARGTLSGTAPNLTYTPSPNLNGADSFTFKANDGVADSNVATVSISVSAVNDAPTADPKSVSGVPSGSATAIGLSGTDVDGNALTFAIVSPPAYGTLGPVSGASCSAGSCTASVSYTSVAGYHGADSFTYRTSDGTLQSPAATVSLSVANAPPVASDQSVSTDEDTPVAVTLSATDPDGDPLTYTTTPPSHGTISGTAPALTYTPAANYNGPDSFTFRASDGTSQSGVATVSITVAPVADAPRADPKSVPGAHQRVPVSIALSGSDADGEALTFAIASGPSHGIVGTPAGPSCTAGSCTASVTYTPAAGYAGADSFTYTTSDGSLTSAPATVSITVVNQAPVAQSQSVTTAAGVSRSITLTASDPESDPLTWTVLTQPLHGTLAGAAPALTYTPASGYSGADSFSFRVSDGIAESNTATVSVTVTFATRGIVFTATRDGQREIYTMQADGTQQRRITVSGKADHVAAWSPDGSRIAFVSNRTGDNEIWVMNADGTGQSRLTTSSGSDTDPAFSPSGSKIAFTSSRSSTRDVYVMNADGTGVTRLTTSGTAKHPAWSPDGTKIAFARANDVWVMNADGSGARIIVAGGTNQEPDWSPKGSRIAFATDRDGDWDVYVANADGSGQTRLTTALEEDSSPAWSPDGARIAFMSLRDDEDNVYVMNADGSGQARLTTDVDADTQPDW